MTCNHLTSRLYLKRLRIIGQLECNSHKFYIYIYIHLLSLRFDIDGGKFGVSLVVENLAELNSCNRFFGCRFDKIKLSLRTFLSGLYRMYF